MKKRNKFVFIVAVFITIIFALRLLEKHILPIIAGIIFIIMISASAERTITQTVPSPNGTYEAYVLSVDAGAAASNTIVYVKKVKGVEIFQHKDKKLQSGNWQQTYDIEWQDDDSLFVDGKIYEMEDMW